MNSWRPSLSQFEDKISILIVDDDEALRHSLEVEIKLIFGGHRKGQLRFEQAVDIKEALKVAGEDTFDLIITDHEYWPSDEKRKHHALDYIDRLSELQYKALFLVLSSFDTDTTLASKYVAKDVVLGFLSKSESPGAIEYRTTMILKSLNIILQNIETEKRQYLKNPKLNIHKYKSPAMQKIYKKLESYKKYNHPILIVGEPGTGKTHLAEQLNEMMRIHNKQKNRVFVDKNMAAFTETLVEAELFGAEAGAYTGANKRRIGLFEYANDGTFFLDEVGETKIDIQPKLLKAIDQNKIMRVGGNTEIHVTPRIILATNRDLENMVEQGLFREDLFERINTFKIEMPALKDRKEDIPVLCEDICEGIRKNDSVEIYYKDFKCDLKEYLEKGEMKGNIRGLYGILLRLAVESNKTPTGKIIYSNWREILGVKEDDAQEFRGVERKDYDEMISQLSQMILEKDELEPNQVKEDLEYNALKYLKEMSEKKKLSPTKVGKIFKFSKTTAHTKIEKFEKKEEQRTKR